MRKIPSTTDGKSSWICLLKGEEGVGEVDTSEWSVAVVGDGKAPLDDVAGINRF